MPVLEVHGLPVYIESQTMAFLHISLPCYLLFMV